MSRYGSLSGLSGDQIMYASQASECLFIVDNSGGQKIDVCRTEILPENMHGHHDEMLIEFTKFEAIKLEQHYNLGPKMCKQRVRVEFEVKHFYFDLLHKSLRSLSNTHIAKVMPMAGDHVSHHRDTTSISRPNTYDFLKLDKESQLPALQLITSSRYRALELVSGAFGTGKTRLLAVATHYFIEEGRQKRIPTRVLLCCHHQITADTFIEKYFGKMQQSGDHQWRTKVVRLTRARYVAHSNYQYLFMNNIKFKEVFTRELCREDYLVVVTTFLTGLNVCGTIGENFFTHILLDEAAQVREPEAVAPLCMANQDTKIVIAGDDHQVRL